MYKVNIKQGDFLEEDAQIIVNPSNTKLILGSGVSMAIKRKCGFKLQELMDIEKEKKVYTKGDIAITNDSSNNYEKIIHACIMNYSDKSISKFPDLNDIEKVLFNIEDYLIKNNLTDKKIAIPMIGCGVGNLKIIDVINLYIKFFSRETSLNNKISIYIYDYDNFVLVNKLSTYK